MKSEIESRLSPNGGKSKIQNSILSFEQVRRNQTFLENSLPLPLEEEAAKVVREPRWWEWSRLRKGRVWPALGAVLGVGLVWQWLSHSGLVAPYLMPTPHKVLNSWLYLMGNGTLWKHLGQTSSEAVLGFLLAFLVGGGVGYIVARSELLAWLLAPLIAGTQAMPMIALAPVLVMWFGLGLSSKIIICALIVFFPILVNTVVGLRSVERDMLDAACNLGANGWQTFWHVEVPLSLRTLLGGVRMGLTLSLTGAIVGEFVASDGGLGFLMMLSRTSYDSSMLFASALTMASLAIFCYLLVGFLEQILIDW